LSPGDQLYYILSESEQLVCWLQWYGLSWQRGRCDDDVCDVQQQRDRLRSTTSADRYSWAGQEVGRGNVWLRIFGCRQTLRSALLPLIQ